MTADFSDFDAILDRDFLAACEMVPMRVGKALPPDYRAKYGDLFPESAFRIWERFGFDGFSAGRWWFTDPIEWRPVVDAWMSDVALGFDDVFHCVGCNAVGCMSLWGERTWRTVWIDAPLWRIEVWMQDFDHDDAYQAEVKISQIMTNPLDVGFDSLKRDTMAYCLEHLGQLQLGEIYGDPGAQFLLPGDIYASPMERVAAIPFLTEYASIRPRQVTLLPAEVGPAPENKWLIDDPSRPEFWDVLPFRKNP